MTKRIFIDTSGWVELMLRGEKYHRQVAGYFLREAKRGSQFVTCDYVLDESWTRLITNQNIGAALRLKEKVSIARGQGFLTISFTDEKLFEKSWLAFLKYSDHKLSFTDSLIITLVKDLRIEEVLTLDQGIQKTGVKTYPDLSQP